MTLEAPAGPAWTPASAFEPSADPGGPALPSSLGAYSVPEGVAADGVLSGEGGAAQHDEDEDEVGEDVVVDELVAAHADPAGRATARMRPRRARARRPALSARGGHSVVTDQAEDGCPRAAQTPTQQTGTTGPFFPRNPEASVWTSPTDHSPHPEKRGHRPSKGEEMEASACERTFLR